MTRVTNPSQNSVGGDEMQHSLECSSGWQVMGPEVTRDVTINTVMMRY